MKFAHESAHPTAGPRVLALYPWNPSPPTTGGEHAVFDLSQALARHTPCTLAVIDEAASTLTQEDVSPQITLAKLPASDYRRNKLSRLKAPSGLLDDTSPLKRSLRQSTSRQLRAALSELALQHDVIVFCSPWMWPIARHVPAILKRPIVYDAQNVEAEIALQQTPARWRARLYQYMTARIEASLCRAAAQVWCCSDQDAACFRELLPQADRQKVQIGFKGRNQCEQPIQGFHRRTPSAVFVGSAWGPNMDAAQYIATTLAPQLPQYQFCIAGKCGEHLSGTLPPNVAVLGYVADLDAELLKHRVALNPITSGSGINIKLLDYLATGTPVISTPFGARGLPDDIQRSVTQCAVHTFAQEVAHLMEDESLWTTHSQQLLNEFARHFDWHTVSTQAWTRVHQIQQSHHARHP
ncbi:MAG: glycosyltransferase [Aquabacterium sp.]|uniref:glycosyltransferase n=1 Tax=Aquabacterium sp. TaxID=1872578 RepID=UPI003BCE34E4